MDPELTKGKYLDQLAAWFKEEVKGSSLLDSAERWHRFNA